jgi:hypothetical protein
MFLSWKDRTTEKLLHVILLIKKFTAKPVHTRYEYKHIKGRRRWTTIIAWF